MEITQELVKENQATFIKALRSGEYEQIKDVIFGGGNRYCVAGLGLKLFFEDQDRTVSLMWAMDAQGMCVKLSKAIGLHVDWIDRGETVKVVGQLGHLIKLNNEGKTFEELADYLIQEHGFPDVR